MQHVSTGRHGFWGIFLLAAWPNALFDLCGICCGHFLMPFWQFFGATLMGKALVKVGFQSVRLHAVGCHSSGCPAGRLPAAALGKLHGATNACLFRSAATAAAAD